MAEEVQTTEVRESTPTSERVVREEQPSNGIRAQRIVYYIGGVIIALLFVRLLFMLLGANQGSPFVDFIYNLSAIFVAPFFGIFGQPTFGHSQLETSTLVAIIIYGLITVGVAKLFTLNRPTA